MSRKLEGRESSFGGAVAAYRSALLDLLAVVEDTSPQSTGWLDRFEGAVERQSFAFEQLRELVSEEGTGGNAFVQALEECEDIRRRVVSHLAVRRNEVGKSLSGLDRIGRPATVYRSPRSSTLGEAV